VGGRCSECTFLLALVVPTFPKYRTARAERLCELVDPELIGRRRGSTLDQLGELGQFAERGQVLMGRHLDGLDVWPADAASFCALLRAAHQRLLSDALP
jgi:hypothetical protein